MTIARMKAGLLFGSGFHYRSIKLEGATESWSENSRNGNLSPGRQVRSESFFSQASGSLQMDQKKIRLEENCGIKGIVSIVQNFADLFDIEVWQ